MYPHPPYLGDLVPCEFWLFFKVKMTVKNQYFESLHDIEVAITEQQEHSQYRAFRTVSESVKKNGVSV